MLPPPGVFSSSRISPRGMMSFSRRKSTSLVAVVTAAEQSSINLTKVAAPTAAYKQSLSTMVLWLAISFAVGATISTHDTGPPIGPTKPQFNLNDIFIESALFPARLFLDSARFGESPLPDRNQSHHAMTCFFGAPDNKLFVILNYSSNKLISTIGALIGAWLLCCSHNSGIKESSNSTAGGDEGLEAGNCHSQPHNLFLVWHQISPQKRLHDRCNLPLANLPIVLAPTVKPNSPLTPSMPTSEETQTVLSK